MAVHTYVGARYVPRFVGTYDPTQIYDALDVVDNGSGTSYIARKTVPAGTPLTDTDHWFVYGASSGAIIALQNDMIQAQNDILQAQNDISDLEDLVIKKYLIITDSYGLNTNSDGDNMAEVAESLTGLTLAMCPKSSAGFGGGAPHLWDALDDYTGDKTEITDIIVVAGANDVSTVNTNFADMINGMNTFDAKVKTDYPNAKVALLASGTNYAAISGISADGRGTMIEAYMTGANNLGWAFAENSQFLLHDTRLLQSDLIHPSSDGVNMLGRAIAQYILTGVVNFYRRMIHSSFSNLGSNITSLTAAFDEISINGLLMWYRNGSGNMLNVTFTTAVTIGSNGASNWVKLGEMPDRMTDTFSTDNKWLIAMPAMLTNSDNTRSMGEVRFSIQRGDVYIDIWSPSNVAVKSLAVLGDSMYVPNC